MSLLFLANIIFYILFYISVCCFIPVQKYEIPTEGHKKLANINDIVSGTRLLIQQKRTITYLAMLNSSRKSEKCADNILEGDKTVIIIKISMIEQ